MAGKVQQLRGLAKITLSKLKIYKMENLKFKTNIKCTGCLSKVTEPLNKKVGEGNWEVDLLTLKKTLTINNDSVTAAEVIDTLKNAGFQAEQL